MRIKETLLIICLALCTVGLCSCEKTVSSKEDALSEIGGGMHLLTKESFMRANYDLDGWSRTQDLAGRKETHFVTNEYTTLYNCDFGSTSIVFGNGDFFKNNNVISKIILTKEFSNANEQRAFRQNLIDNINLHHKINSPNGDFTIVCPVTLVFVKSSKNSVSLEVRLNPDRVNQMMLSTGNLSDGRRE